MKADDDYMAIGASNKTPQKRSVQQSKNQNNIVMFFTTNKERQSS